MAWPFEPRSSRTAKEVTGSKWTGSCAKRRARRSATSSRWKSRRWLRNRNPGCRPISGRLSLAAHPKARAVWSDITPVARRDWIQWIESAKREETRLKRIESACDMLTKGKRRPCCFDRSGMYAKSLSCPVADDTSSDTRR